MAEVDRLEENLNRWAFFYPEEAKALKVLKPKRIFLCTTGHGELNLRREADSGIELIHSESGALQEAKEWFTSLDLEDATVVYIYGLGLGYAYDAAGEWLSEDPDRYLIFLENDPEILRCFLGTERATAMLHDWQVRICPYTDPLQEESVLNNLAGDFPLRRNHVTAFPSFEKDYPGEIEKKRATIYYYTQMKTGMLGEYFHGGEMFYQNFYHNLFFLPQSSVFSPLVGKFKGVPAIICGAGPSLDKNYDVLRTLTDRALIFGGGTSMNALNAKGIDPHFGAGIDPNWIQFTRLIANTGFTVPFFFRSRMNGEALDVVHGQKIYVPGAGGHNVADWYDEQLGMEKVTIYEGFNVVNLSVSMAHLLGCSPIVFVGLDLSYEGEQSYASDMDCHALHVRRKEFRTKGIEDELLVQNDVNGKPVLTQWRWVAESTWYVNYLSKHPDTVMINATEGGIGLPGIEHMTLQKAADQFMKQRYDLSGKVHRELQYSQVAEHVTNDVVVSVVTEVKKSLEKSQGYCKEIIQKYLECGILAEEAQSSLEKEIVFEEMLKAFSDKFEEIYKTRFQELAYDHSRFNEAEIRDRKILLETARYDFVRKTCLSSIAIINRTLNKHQKNITVPFRKFLDVSEGEQGEGEYSYKDNLFVIEDPVLNLSINEIFHPDASEEGQFYKENELHGPSRFYSEDGKLLAETWYYEGEKIGTARTWYLDGNLERILHYRNGKYQGNQEYFYPDGNPRAKVPYDRGKFDGTVFLYYPNGSLKRKLGFRQGKRHGIEEMFSLEGNQIINAEYKEGQPIGAARQWYENGVLARELIYDQESNLLDINIWNETGTLQKQDKSDYFDSLTEQTTVLTDSLQEVHKHFNTMAEIVSSEAGGDDLNLTDDLADIQNELAHLQELNEEIMKETGTLSHTSEETLWKSPSSKKELSEQVSEATGKLSEELEGVHEALRNVIGALIKKSDKEKKD